MLTAQEARTLKKWLESLGYQVSCGNDQRDGAWFNVRW